MEEARIMAFLLFPCGLVLGFAFGLLCKRGDS